MHGRHGEHTTRKALGRQCCRLSIQMPSLSQLVDLDPDVVLFAGSKWFKPEIPSRHESHVLRLNGVFFSLQVSSEPTARYRHVIKMSTQKHKITIIWGCLKFFATICVSFSPACFAGCIFLRVAICTAWTEKQKMIGFCANHFAWVTASPNSFTGAKHRAKKVITLYLIWCLKIYLLCMLIVFAKRKPVCCSRSLYAFSIIGLVWLPVGYLFVPFSPLSRHRFFPHLCRLLPFRLAAKRRHHLRSLWRSRWFLWWFQVRNPPIPTQCELLGGDTEPRSQSRSISILWQCNEPTQWRSMTQRCQPSENPSPA